MRMKVSTRQREEGKGEDIAEGFLLQGGRQEHGDRPKAGLGVSHVAQASSPGVSVGCRQAQWEAAPAQEAAVGMT